ncbi:MerR family transcriptional regulator [Nonomuraea typhae]|uniref:helix-turn-helix domain-containing protein n=1 Tax=Nonomuraea typhae TaxID=2603600 RepID=UPI0012FCB451|nr:MerR family transcriptional regulator [Nonomuraea typhae]
MTQNTLGIGDLARLTGLSVRTIRFYCDAGLLDSRRSPGGHRRFEPGAVERLTLVRRLRGLGFGLTAIEAVLAGERSVAEAVAAERAALDVELATLAWRHASLRAVEEAGPAARAARLDLVAAVTDRGAAHDALVGFWKWQIGTWPDQERCAFLSMTAPEPPADPTPTQVVAYAELVSVATDRSLLRLRQAQTLADAGRIHAGRDLMAATVEAWLQAEAPVLAGEPPGPSLALDTFVAAQAGARRVQDSQAFRRDLLGRVAMDRDPRMRRYWRLLREITGERATLGDLHTWILDGLEVSVTPGRESGGSWARNGSGGGCAPA